MNQVYRTLILAAVLLAASQTEAQEPKRTETLITANIDNGWLVSPDVKLSSLGGEFQAFAGFHGGWVIDHKFMIGFAAYGNTGEGAGFDMAYGGLLLEYLANPNKLLNYSVRALLGGGAADAFRSRHHGGEVGFFAFEPEARVTLNVTRHFRVGFGGGYRFVGASAGVTGLGGPTATFSFKFGSF